MNCKLGQVTSANLLGDKGPTFSLEESKTLDRSWPREDFKNSGLDYSDYQLKTYSR